MRAQSAIEFITAYSWAFLLLLLVAFISFYYVTSQQPPTQCNFGTDLQCPSFKFFQNSSNSMRLIFQLNNGMGKVVNLSGNSQIIVQNVGKTGTNSYNGTCWGAGAVIRYGDPVYCSFNITDMDMVPSINKNVKFDVLLNYTDCETSPDYPRDCIGGLNRTAHGSITATFEERPGVTTAYCGDGICAASETCSSCPQDCGPCIGTTCTINCSFNNVCNASCVGMNGCANFRAACNKVSFPSTICSDSAGGLTGSLDYKVSCCNGTVTSALRCYQKTSTTVGWCGDYSCDSSAGENCSTCSDCPPCANQCNSTCVLPDNRCYLACAGINGCPASTFRLACNNTLKSAQVCSNSTGGTSFDSGQTTLNYNVSCCNGGIGSAPSCYQNTTTTIGWCGDGYCDTNHETCSSCPQECGQCPSCQPDCTFGTLGKCNSTCAVSCLNFNKACHWYTPGSNVCSNSTGGTSFETGQTALYNISSCCNGTITSCGTNSTCSSVAFCNASQNCTYSLQASCNENCTGAGICNPCTPTCSPTCTDCPSGQGCLSGNCIPVCQPDCTFGTLGICNSTCSGSNGCSNVSPACDTYATSANRCSNSTGGTSVEGASSYLNYNVSCCSGAVGSALHCYQKTPTTIGWCGDSVCDAGNGENPANCLADCPSLCNSDCTFSTLGICNSTCSGVKGCLNPLPVCNGYALGSNACSNSTGGTSGSLNYNVSCCSGTATSCGSNSTCPANYCNSSATLCSYTASTCNFTCSSGTCGTYCNACGAPACSSCGTTACPSQSCSGGQLTTYPATCSNTCSGTSCSTCSCTPTVTTCDSGLCCGSSCCTCVGSTPGTCPAGWKCCSATGMGCYHSMGSCPS